MRYVEFELATIVPVLARPRNVRPLVHSFLTSGQPGILLFVVEVDDNDEMIAVRREAAETRVHCLPVVDAHTWPEKINAGVQAINATWYLCAADDVRFTPGWWATTAHLRHNPQVGVIGTNDSLNGPGNQAVAAGRHTCHPLIRGTYIRDHGTWDEPGKAIHEGYAHWYCDNELVATAMLRDAWAYSPETVIEHLHPYWNGGNHWDSTYQLGQRNAEEDGKVWRRRAEQMGLI